MYQYTSPQKTASRSLDLSGVYIGEVVRSDSDGVFVKVPQLALDAAFGPCPVMSESSATVAGTAPAAGTRVVCSFLENKFDELIILGVIL